MPSLTIAQTIAAPVERVWTVFTDLGAAARNLKAVEKIELVSSGAFGEGTRWRETRKMYGKSVTEEMWVSAVEPGKSYTVDAGSNHTNYRSRYVFTPVGDASTTVRFTFSAESSGATGVLSTIMWPLFKRRLAKDLRKDMNDLARVCTGV